MSLEGEFETLRPFAQDGYAHGAGRLLETSPGVFFGTASSASGGIVYKLTVGSPFGISLVTPMDGQKLFADVPTTIHWTASGGSRIDVELSRNAGRTFEPIAECAVLPGSATSCTWTPSGPPTQRARIRVVVHGPVGEAASDETGNFRIAGAAPRVKVEFPSGRVALLANTRVTIWWTHNLGARSFVRVEYSLDGGANWGLIARAVENVDASSGSFNWLVGPTPSTNALIRVTSLSTGVLDVSNRPFTIGY